MWWMGITGPPNLPSFVLETWNNALVKVVKNPKFVSKAENMGMSFFSRIHWRLGILRRKRLKR
jgi:tripartite-type tricarboxylate transporter receptor subunit TctC